jgi:hypothetical protein
MDSEFVAALLNIVDNLGFDYNPGIDRSSAAAAAAAVPGYNRNNGSQSVGDMHKIPALAGV